jgi:signal transduction histidine kinase
MDKSMKRQERLLKRSALVMIAVVFFSLIILMVMIIFEYYQQMDEKLYEERKLHLVEYTDKVSDIIDEKVESAGKKLSAAKHVLLNEGRDLETADDLLDLLAATDDFVNPNVSTFLVFDENGTYYSSDGHIGYWEDNSVFDEDDKKQQKSIVQLPHIPSRNFLFFAERIDGLTLKESGKRLTHIAIAVNSDSVKEGLSISGFGNECYSYIINDSGRRLYQYTYENNFISGYNIFESIGKYRVIHGGSFDILKDAVNSNESAALEFRYVDDETGAFRDWFVACSDVADVDWSVLLFVPKDVLGANTDDLLAETTRFFVLISAIVIVCFLMLMFVIIVRRADEQIIREKEASNILLEEAAIRAENANQAKSKFLSRMSHDIRTPINAIMGMTGIAIRHIDDKEKVRDCLGKIEGASQHLFSLINDVLDMSRIESGKTEITMQPFHLGVCLANCASIIEGQVATRDLELVRDFEELEHPVVVGDELHLRQILINILGNSVKFTPDGGKLYFTARQTELDGKNAYRFVLADTGVGMKEEFLPHLYEAFAQEEGDIRTDYKGTGLGMAIVKQFVDMMQGTIEVESKLGAGTRTIVTIPMEIADTVVQDEKTEHDNENFNLKGMKVLLAEDNELNMEIAEELLAEQGIDVTPAENGKIAVELYEQSDPGTFDAILMDVMMPVMDGLTAAKTIRASFRPDAKTIPILAMTANAYDEDIKKTKDAGMNSHLSKPIDEEILLKTLARYY